MDAETIPASPIAMTATIPSKLASEIRNLGMAVAHVLGAISIRTRRYGSEPLLSGDPAAA